MRLGPATLGRVPQSVAVPQYDRAAQGVGIVHFGLGAFARAHLAWYTDACLDAGERDWLIAGVSLRSAAVAAAINPQAGLYTLTRRSGGDACTQVIGSLAEVLVAGADNAAIVARIASPACHVVSFTVTEKGYCRDGAGGLDFAAAQASFYPLLAAGLRQRMAAGLPGVTLLSLDNLPHNGAVLAGLLDRWLMRANPDLARWVAAQCTCPGTMVDRIVPATRAEDSAALAEAMGLADEGAVFTEAFSQWVIENRFAASRPHWEDRGAQIVADVAPYESAKLRMLNGAHSLLAYVGLSAGHEFVHQAVGDPAIRPLVEQLLRHEAAPTVAAAPGQDLAAYAAQLIERFADPALNHRLAQIAMDGSQKLPQRWLATLAEAQAPCPAILTGIAAWLWHIADGRWLDDPRADALRDAVAAGDVAHQLAALFGSRGVLETGWMPSLHDSDEIAHARRTMGRGEQ